MSGWKDHKMAIILNELPKPILAIWFLVKDILEYVLQLFCVSWKSMRLAINKDIIIPSFIGTFAMLVLFNTYFFINSKFGIFPSSSSDILAIFFIMGLLPVAWMFSVIASVRNSIESKENAHNWRLHVLAGFKATRFFLTYSVFIALILIVLWILNAIGFIPQIDQFLLGLLSPLLFLLSLILILSFLGLALGSVLFGGYHLSKGYKESSSFSDRTKSLFLMVARKMTDWIGISIPSFFISCLFLLVPFFLTVTALEIMRIPGQAYGIGVPGLQLNYKYELGSNSFYVSYPDKYEVDSMEQEFKFKKHELDIMQSQYDSSKDSANSFLMNANDKSWGARWYLNNDKLAFEEEDDWTEEKWIVGSDSIEYFENGERKWVSGVNGEVSFVGNYHYPFFIFLTDMILVFVNALILAFPLCFFFASLGSTYYSMYSADFKIGILKKIVGIVFLVVAINISYKFILFFLNTLMI